MDDSWLNNTYPKEDGNEKLAQLQYENTRLKEELNYIGKQYLSYEETHNTLILDLAASKTKLKSCEQQITDQSQLLEKKDDQLESYEQTSKDLREKYDQLKLDNAKLKITQKRLDDKCAALTEELELLKVKEKNFESSLMTVSKERDMLLLECDRRAEEHIFAESMLNSLRHQVKTLEDECAGLHSRLHMMVAEEIEVRLRTPKQLSIMFDSSGKETTGLSPPLSSRRLQFDEIGASTANNDISVVTLREEILQSQILEKDEKIQTLETLLSLGVGQSLELTAVESYKTAASDGKSPESDLTNSDSFVTVIKASSSLFQENHNCFIREEVSERKPEGGSDPSDMTSTEGVSNSDSDSTDSRDINLNSKNFDDCNLFGNIKKSVKRSEFNASSYCPSGETEANGGTETARDEDAGKSELTGENRSSLGENVLVGNVPEESLKIRESLVSTPYPVSQFDIREWSRFDSLSSIESEDSKLAQDRDGNTYTVETTALTNGTCLSNEEIEKKFQDLGIAFRTDAMTLQKRLTILKRQRDQAEVNVEREVHLVKSTLDSLQYLCIDGDSIQILSEAKRHLDIVLSSVLSLSSTAESYGYVQNEEKVAENVAVMIQHVENLERVKSDSNKPSERLKTDSKRSPFSPGDEREEERLLRRRSVAATTGTGSARRRASIASFLRTMSSKSDTSGLVPPPQTISNYPIAASSPRRVSTNLSPTRSFSNNPLVSGDNPFPKRNSSGRLRLRGDSRASENAMQHIEELSERLSIGDADVDSESGGNSDDCNLKSALDESKLLKGHRVSSSMSESRSSSISLETLNILDSLRRLVEWNIMLVSSARLRWPDTARQYVPFVMTWYVIMVVAFVFAGGLLVGINGCCATYSRHIASSLTWSLAVTSLIVATSLFRLLFSRPLLLTCFGLVVWLALAVLWRFRQEDLRLILESFGVVFQVRYPNGPPPV